MGVVGGLQQKAWGLAESTFDTPAAFAATDAFDFTDLKINPSLNFEKMKSHVGTMSNQGFIEQRRGGKWSGSIYVMPGALGVAPDIGWLLDHAFGAAGTVVGGTSVTYNLNDSHPTLGLQLVKHASDALLEQANGAWVEEIEFVIGSGEAVMLNVSGGFASYGMLLQGLNTLASTVEPIAETVIALESGGARAVRPGVYIEIGTDDNSGSGYRVTAVSYSADTMTITPGLASATSGGEAITPHVPSQTLTGSPLGGINCGCTLDGTSMDMESASVKFTTGVKGIDSEATTNRPSGMFRGARVIEGDITVIYKAENAAVSGGGWNANVIPIILRGGPNTAGSRAVMTIPAALVHVVEEIEQSDDDPAKMKLHFEAKQSSAAADEMTLAFT